MGLLLTFGNYHSELTYEIFIGAVGLIILMFVALMFGRKLMHDLVTMGPWEALSLCGLFLIGFSTLFFAFGQVVIGTALALGGLLGIIFGSRGRKEKGSIQPAAPPTEIDCDPSQPSNARPTTAATHFSPVRIVHPTEPTFPAICDAKEAQDRSLSGVNRS